MLKTARRFLKKAKFIKRSHASALFAFLHFKRRRPYLKQLYLHPWVRRLKRRGDDVAREHAQYGQYVDSLAPVLQYRQAYFEITGKVAPHAALPKVSAWPEKNKKLSYADKLVNTLSPHDKGAEIGPLNQPILAKDKSKVLYVDHLDTKGLKEKYPTIQGIVEIDRPMVNNSIKDTLQGDAPLDYLVASQVFEHVPNPVAWLQEIAFVLRTGGLLCLSLPDRRMTFDLFREETRAADMVAAYLENHIVPGIRAVYDHHALAGVINMNEVADSVLPQDILAGRGAIKARVCNSEPLSMASKAKENEYFDVHAWVFTPPSFLLVMAQLAADGLLPFRLHQFYPTDPESFDRDNHSFTAILQKVETQMPVAEIRRSYLYPFAG